MSQAKAFLRRHAAILMFLAAVTWIITVVLLIMTMPGPGGGSPV